MIKVKEGGTPNIYGWKQGDRVFKLAELEVGDVLLNVSFQFDAQNLCRVTRHFENEQGVLKRPICYAIFVDPKDTSRRRAGGDHEFAIWDHNLDDGFGCYYKVEKCDDLVLSPSQIVGLMRKHKVKMRDMKAKYGITLKRIREVRKQGLMGFAAEEWTYLITGQWPVTPGAQQSP